VINKIHKIIEKHKNICTVAQGNRKRISIDFSFVRKSAIPKDNRTTLLEYLKKKKKEKKPTT
jgi:hypothetical protein